MKRASVRAAAGRYAAGLILLAAGLLSAGWAAAVGVARPARVLAGDRPVDRAAGDPGDLSAFNSPTLVRNPRDPRDLVVTSRIDAPDFSCAVHASVDGGARWTRTRVPIPPPARKCYAPDAGFGPDGTVWVSYVTLRGLGNTPSAVWVAASRDGGRTLAPPRRAGGPLAFQVRIAADPARRGRIYATWVQARAVGNLKFAGPGNPVVATRSDDGGATWSPPVRVSDPRRGRVLAPVPAVGPRGELYVLYLDVGGDRLDYEGAHEGAAGPPYPGRFALVLARSLDLGRTWEQSVVDDRVVPVGRFIPFLAPFPSLAVDRGDGRVYAGFHDARLGTPDVWVWSLAPDSARWSPPVRVNDTPRADGSSQTQPQIAVAPGGRLDVVYYDRRADPRDVRDAVSLQSSGDGGRTFGPHLTLSSRSFDSRIGFGSAGGLATLGSRLGLVSGRTDALAAWSDTRAGTEASGKQDVVAAAASPARTGVPPGAAELAGRGGIALVAGGLAALALARRRSTRR